MHLTDRQFESRGAGEKGRTKTSQVIFNTLSVKGDSPCVFIKLCLLLSWTYSRSHCGAMKTAPMLLLYLRSRHSYLPITAAELNISFLQIQLKMMIMLKLGKGEIPLQRFIGTGYRLMNRKCKNLVVIKSSESTQIFWYLGHNIYLYTFVRFLKRIFSLLPQFIKMFAYIILNIPLEKSLMEQS